ncbi:hypothetical protein NCER_102421 [Vairimorpha ceranae BRL01]|uniref:Uncharacterized protein n=1 Tax=Vairimorpha ceranae (strain BRL01) TaxID=578460 RepID=C4VC00_VAIC1|nr:hypothetical protein NCER_102421 [Vairimorpha ceranae BRL01]
MLRKIRITFSSVSIYCRSITIYLVQKIVTVSLSLLSTRCNTTRLSALLTAKTIQTPSTGYPLLNFCFLNLLSSTSTIELLFLKAFRFLTFLNVLLKVYLQTFDILFIKYTGTCLSHKLRISVIASTALIIFKS